MKNYLRLLAFLKKHLFLLGIAVVSIIISGGCAGITLLPIVPLADRIFNHGKVVFPHRLPPFLEEVVDYINQADPMALLGTLSLLGLVLIL